MTTSDTIKSKGLVSPSFIDISTGMRIPWEQRHNTISHEASFSMANAFGGNLNYIPNRIGIIYGPYETPTLSDITRNQSWESLKYELESDIVKSDVQVAAFSYSPSIKRITRPSETYDTNSNSSDSSESSDPEIYETGYSVTFHSHSDSTTPGALVVADTLQGQNVDKNSLLIHIFIRLYYLINTVMTIE